MKRTKLLTAAKFATYFLLFALLNAAETKSGLTPFGLGLFVALVYCRENLWLLAPLYVLASFTAGVSWQGLVCAATPAVVFAVAYFVHYKVGKPINLLLCTVYALLSEVPNIAFAVGDASLLLDACLSVLLSILFVYCCTIAVYAVKIRGVKYRFSVDELISTEVLVTVGALAIWCVSLWGFRPFFGVAAFVILCAAYAFPLGVTLSVATLFGLGQAFSSGNITLVAVLVFWALAASSLHSKTMLFSAVAVLAADALAGLYFNAYTQGYSWLNLLSLSLGIVAFLLLPKSAKQYLCGTSKIFADGYSTRTLVNRSRGDVAEKLSSLACVFSDMHRLLKTDLRQADELSSAERLGKEISRKVCSDCENLRDCCTAMGGDTSTLLTPIAETVLEQGRATMLTMPTFISSRCKRIPELLNAYNRGIRAINEWEATRDNLDCGKLMLADQMNGMGELLNGLATDTKKRLSFDAALEKRLIDELSHRNIVVNEAAVYGEERKLVTLVLRETDADKPLLLKELSRLMNEEMEIYAYGDVLDGWKTLHFRRAPTYDVEYGCARETKYGNTVSGDTLCVERVEDTAIFALSDGMGSGEAAARSSAAALSLIENFYRAGFPNEVVLALTNKMLSLRGGESFSTLDIAAVNLDSGEVDIIKLGAAEGALKHGSQIELIGGSGLPVGILDRIAPGIQRKTMERGDILVTMSDGVMDVLGGDRVIDLLARAGDKPDDIAHTLLNAAKSLGVYDDASVLAFKLT